MGNSFISSSRDYHELSRIVNIASSFTLERDILEGREKKLDIEKKEIMDKIQQIKQKNDKDFYQENIGELRTKVKRYTEEKNRVDESKIKLEKKIKDEKEKIIADLKDKQEKIFKYRHEKNKKLDSKKRGDLLEERGDLIEEIRTREHLDLMYVTDEELKYMFSEDRQKVEQARKKDKHHQERIDKITERLKIADLFDGREPVDAFKRNKIIIENIEERFNIKKIDTITSAYILTSKIDDKNKEQVDDSDKKTETKKQPQQPQQSTSQPNANQKTQTEKQPQQPQQSTSQPNANQKTQTEEQPQQPQPQLQPQVQQVVEPQYQSNAEIIEPVVDNLYDIVGNISILEAEGVVFYNIGNQEGKAFLKKGKAGKIEKKEMFKRLNIKKRVKGFRALRKVNPTVIKVLEQMENSDVMIDQYLQSIGEKKQFNFQLNHDLTGLNIIQKIRINRQAKYEQKCGANITGKLFDKYYGQAIEEPKQPATIAAKTSRSEKMNSYRADTETIHKTEQIGRSAGQTIGEKTHETVNGDITQQETITI